MKIKSLIILNAVCALTYAKVCYLNYGDQQVSEIFNGPTICENGEVDSITVNGPLTIKGTTIQNLLVNGPVTSNLANVNSSTINGLINANQSKFNDIKVNGVLSSKNSEFSSVKMHGDSNFTDSVVYKSLSISKDTDSKNELKTYLYQNTIIHGDIVFQNGEGIVYKSTSATINGKVYGGKIIDI